MAAPMNASLPPFFTLSDGMQVRLTALAAADGSLVSGVSVSQVSVDVDFENDTGPLSTPTTVAPSYFVGDV